MRAATLWLLSFPRFAPWLQSRGQRFENIGVWISINQILRRLPPRPAGSQVRPNGFKTFWNLENQGCRMWQIVCEHASAWCCWDVTNCVSTCNSYEEHVCLWGSLHMRVVEWTTGERQLTPVHIWNVCTDVHCSVEGETRCELHPCLNALYPHKTEVRRWCVVYWYLIQ